jgi:hypothetical protein
MTFLTDSQEKEFEASFNTKVDNYIQTLKDEMGNVGKDLKQARKIRSKQRKRGGSSYVLQSAEMMVTLLTVELETLDNIVKNFSYNYVVQYELDCKYDKMQYGEMIKGLQKSEAPTASGTIGVYNLEIKKLEKRLEVIKKVHAGILEL